MTSKRSLSAESCPLFCRLWMVREERSVRQLPCSELDQWNQHPSFSTLFPGPSRGEVVVLRESLRTDLIVLAFLWSSESAPGEAAALVFREDQMCSLEGAVYSCSRWRKDATFRASTACDNCMPACTSVSRLRIAGFVVLIQTNTRQLSTVRPLRKGD